MNKIQRVSFCFKILFQITMVTMFLLQILGWIQAPEAVKWPFLWFSVIPRTYINIVPPMMTLNMKLMGFAASMVPVIIEMFVLYFLIKLFQSYEQGEYFSLNNVRYIRNVGYALLLDQFVNPFYQFVMGVVLTWNNPPGHRIAAITLNQTNLGMVITAFLVLVISWIMAEGYKMREEQQLTI